MNKKIALTLSSIILVVIAILIVLWPEPSNQLNMAITQEPDTLDIHRTSEPAASAIFVHICETLIYQDLDLNPKPLLAKSWEFSEDGLTLTFILRDDVVFHDNTPFNAEAVQFTYARLQNDESQLSPLYDAFQDVEITVIDAYTVSFGFQEPRYDFLTTLRNSYASIISPTSIKNNASDFGENPVCTGAYRVKEWRNGEYILLTKNDDYAWAPSIYTNQGPSQINEIRFSFITNTTNAYNALLAGELDFWVLNTPDEVNHIKGMSTQFTLYESAVGGISYFGFNYQKEPTSDLALRQAMAHAINKEIIVNRTLPDMGQSAFAILTERVYGFSDDLKMHEYEYNPDLARQILADNGYIDSDGDGFVEFNGNPLKLTILTTTDDIYQDIYVLLKDQFRQIGIDVEIRQEPPAIIAEITPTGDFDLLLYHYNWPYPTALNLFLHSENIGGPNRVWYSNETVDNLLDQHAQLPESPEKLQLLTEAQTIILQDVPWQPLLNRTVVTAVNNRVDGIIIHPSGGLLLHDATINETP